jgi:hypothetical protein
LSPIGLGPVFSLSSGFFFMYLLFDAIAIPLVTDDIWLSERECRAELYCGDCSPTVSALDEYYLHLLSAVHYSVENIRNATVFLLCLQGVVPSVKILHRYYAMKHCLPLKGVYPRTRFVVWPTVCIFLLGSPIAEVEHMLIHTEYCLSVLQWHRLPHTYFLIDGVGREKYSQDIHCE